MNDDTTRHGHDDATSRTTTLRVIATVLLIGAAWVLATILIPFALALVLAVALSPLANRLERLGLPRVLSSLACMLLVAALLVGAVGMFTYEAGTILQDADRYMEGFGRAVDRGMERVGLARHDTADADADADAPGGKGGHASRSGDGGRGQRVVRRSVDALGGWLMRGVGGAIGVLGGAVVVLAYLFYMLYGRDGWIDAITDASRRLGLRPTRQRLDTVRAQVGSYVAALAAVSACYMVVVSVVLWLIGVPQPVLWGVMAGLFEVVPYFGPIVSSVLPTLVSFSLGTWWQPALTAGLFIVLHTIEGYVITPMLYGRTVRFDPVTILFNALFVGAIWGPFGLAVATPLLIILRGLLLITPDTPALDALADVDGEKVAPGPSASG